MSHFHAVRRLLPAAVLAGLVAAIFASGINRYLSLETLRANDAFLQAIVARHPVLSAAVFVVTYTSIVALSVPGGAVMTIAGGWLFGLWLGAALAVSGATTGATILFVVARLAIGDTLRVRAGPFLRRMGEGFERNAFTYLLFLRLVPAFPFWAVNLAPALTGVRLRTYIVATVIGIIPGTLAYASVGDGLGRYFESGSDSALSTVFTPDMIAVRVGVAALGLVPLAIRWIRRRRR